MITSPSVWGSLVDLANNGIYDFVNAGVPTNGTTGTGAGLAGPGSTCTNSVTGTKYLNTGTLASPTWTQILSTRGPVDTVTVSGTAISSVGGTIAPISLIHHVTNTTALATINLPAANFIGTIWFIPNTVFTWNTSGNIGITGTAVVSKALSMTFDGTSWFPGYLS
jgi:hypothetical protein